MDYIILKYRQKFRLSWDEFLATPWKIVIRDLEMLSIESDVLNWKQEQTK